MVGGSNTIRKCHFIVQSLIFDLLEAVRSLNRWIAMQQDRGVYGGTVFHPGDMLSYAVCITAQPNENKVRVHR